MIIPGMAIVPTIAGATVVFPLTITGVPWADTPSRAGAPVGPLIRTFGPKEDHSQELEFLEQNHSQEPEFLEQNYSQE